jgi:uncharacterized membrane protein
MNEQPEVSTGFQFNGPTVVGLLYLATYFTACSALLGVILAYIWRRQPVPEWQQTQFAHLIRTFWLGLTGYAVGAVPALALIGAFGDEASVPKSVMATGFVLGLVWWLLLTVLLLVRCARAIVSAQHGVPMARPRSWTV